MNEKQQQCQNALSKFFEQYKDNDYMLQRIYCHIVQNMPNTLKNECKNYEKRQNLTTYLSEEQQVFMQVFLSKNNYFYLPNNDFFYEYNGRDYLIVKEDDIIHKLLSAISKDRILLQWKHKTKFNVLRKIKERILFQCTPETDTIQDVLNAIYPSIFATKSVAKYFLTIIGDNILKKNNGFQIMISPKMKSLLNELESVASSSIGNDSISSHFITKYHENHSFENLRLIKIADNFSTDYWRELLKKIGLNLLCVAIHYSNRYTNSDHYLNETPDEELREYAYTLKNTTQAEILNRFVNDYLEPTTDEYQIEWKNLHFIWKQFLSSIGLPNVFFMNNLKNSLIASLNYNKDTDSFKGITSKHLPSYRDFIKFWETSIVQSVSPDFENELEIDEICSLYKMWSKNKTHLTEETIIKILKHSFQTIEIVEDKYVLNIQCNMWDKMSDINHALQYFDENIKNDYEMTLISFDEIYNYYQEYCALKEIKTVVSKRYFEKYLNYEFADCIVYEKFIEANIIS